MICPLFFHLSLAAAGTFAGSHAATDFSGTRPLADAVGAARGSDGVITVTCADHSQVRIAVLAPDLVRVRVAFGGRLPEQEHSWAIARTDWPAVSATFAPTAEGWSIGTAAVEVRLRRHPLEIAFADPATGRVINADERPMMTDPRTGAVAAAKRLGAHEHFYGLGEKAAPLDKRRGVFEMWNSDTPNYREGTDPLYQSIPFYLGLDEGRAYGLFFDNSFRTHFDFGSTQQDYAAFWADGGEMNYYFFAGPAMRDVVSRYTELTGRAPLPPLWALGNQQSRYSYYPDTLAEDIVRRYRADDLPLDVLHLDIGYMDGYRVFTFDPHRFPQPKAFTDRLRALGVKVVTIVDPGVKYEPKGGYAVYNEGAAHGYFLRRRGGELYRGEVWPGSAVFVDYTLAPAARWWGDLHRAYTDAGIAGIWDDMNEPSDFIDKSGRSQGDVVFDDRGTHSSYARNRNVFALGMARATYEGLRRLRPAERPFVITRAGYAGVQRYAAMWTGDSPVSWDTLRLAIPLYTSLGLSGESFVGGDIPGFMGRADGELMARAYQIAFLVPFCRNHCDNRSYDHEPWQFGRYYEGIIRDFLKLRYRLLPYLYTAMEEAHRTGMPVVRPLVLNYPSDPDTANCDDEFMVGGDLLIAPVTQPGQTSRMVYLPPGLWYDYWTGRRLAGATTVRAEAPLETVPLYVRGGSILPFGPALHYVGERATDRLEFHVYPDAQGAAAAELYEDDGTSFGYEAGVWRRTRLSARSEGGRTVVELAAPQGTYRPAPRRFAFSRAGETGPGTELSDRGGAATARW